MKDILACFLAFFVTFVAVAHDSTLDKIKNTKVLKVCSESGYLPLEMKTKNDKWLGFDVAMTEYFAKSLGVKIVMLDTKWDGIIPSLLSFKCDVIASSMAITPQRARVISFSDPYYENKFLVAIKNTPRNRERFRTLSDLNASDVIIAVKTGSSPDLFLQDSPLFSKTRVFKYDADADTINAVLNDKTQAFIYDTPYVKLASLHYPGRLYILPQGFKGDQFALAFRKQDKDLITSFNEFLAKWKKDKGKNGFEATQRYYFDTLDWNSELNN